MKPVHQMMENGVRHAAVCEEGPDFVTVTSACTKMRKRVIPTSATRHPAWQTRFDPHHPGSCQACTEVMIGVYLHILMSEVLQTD